MKKSFFVLNLLIFITTYFANVAFAGEPVSGVGIIILNNPGGKPAESSRTGKDGKFILSLPAGHYDITIVYKDVEKTLGAAKNWDGKNVTLLYSSSEIRTLVPNREVISKGSLPITITVHGANATISGSITYEPVTK